MASVSVKKVYYKMLDIPSQYETHNVFLPAPRPFPNQSLTRCDAEETL